MKKIIFVYSVILSGGLFIAGQAIGQFQSTLQQQEQSERSGAEINSAEGSFSTGQTESDTRQDPTDDQQSGFVSGTDQQRFQDTDQEQFDQQRSPQQQMPLQQQFGVSPRFETRGDFQSRQQQTQDRRGDQPGGTSDMTREQDSSAIRGPGKGQGESGSNMQSGQSSSGGGFGGQGGSGGSGGSGGQ